MHDASAADDRTLQVFVLFELELPTAWARRHEQVVVAFDHDSLLGWHARLVGDEGIVLLSFPWTDHVDRILRRGDMRTRRGSSLDVLPIEAADETWDELEQGWNGWVKADGGDVFIAETDFDAMTDAPRSALPTFREPGSVAIDAVEITWSCVHRSAYDEAWMNAIASCKRRDPSPIGEWIDGVGKRMRIRN